MPLRHNLLALAIATIWGLTFVSIKFALQTMPPFALSGWRFFMAVIPRVFFVGTWFLRTYSAVFATTARMGISLTLN